MILCTRKIFASEDAEKEEASEDQGNCLQTCLAGLWTCGAGSYSHACQFQLHLLQQSLSRKGFFFSSDSMNYQFPAKPGGIPVSFLKRILRTCNFKNIPERLRQILILSIARPFIFFTGIACILIIYLNAARPF